MDPHTRFREPGRELVSHRGHTAAVLRLFTTRELITELRDRQVIQGEHCLWLHPHWANALRLQEAEQ